MACGPFAVKVHVLSTKEEKQWSCQENHLELGLQVTSLHLGCGSLLLGCFFISTIKKKEKFTAGLAAEPTETRSATGH